MNAIAKTDRTASLVDHTAERMVLGYLQMLPDALGDVLDVVSAEHFAYPGHGPIFEALRTIIERDGAIAYGPLANELHARKVFNVVGGVQYVADCAEVEDEYGFAITPQSAMAAARLVASLATRRAIFDAARRIAAKALDLAEPVDAVADFATTATSGALATTSMRAGRTFGEATDDVVRRIGNPDFGGASYVLPWPTLSTRLGGLRRKRLHIVAGRPAMGKSAFALNIALALAAPRAWWPEREEALLPQPVPVLMFALEMGDEENAARGIATLAGVEARRMEAGVLAADEEDAVSHAVVHTARAPFVLDDRTRSVARMRTVARQFFARHGKGVMVVDYLQLCSTAGLDIEKGANRERHVASMTLAFKSMAMDLDVAVVLLAQLKRLEVESKGRGDGKETKERAPRMEDLRESGAAEQDADVILLLWGTRPDAGDLTQDVNVRVEKVRGGAAGGDVPMLFTRRSTRFNEAAHAQHESAMNEPQYAAGGFRAQSPRDFDDDFGTEADNAAE